MKEPSHADDQPAAEGSGLAEVPRACPDEYRKSESLRKIGGLGNQTAKRANNAASLEWFFDSLAVLAGILPALTTIT